VNFLDIVRWTDEVFVYLTLAFLRLCVKFKGTNGYSMRQIRYNQSSFLVPAEVEFPKCSSSMFPV